MAEHNELNQKLKGIGLTVYEIKTYKALLSRAELTADEIHQQTKIPKPRIYDTVEGLENKGLVDIIPGRPKRFKIIEPTEGLEKFKETKEREFQEELKNIEGMTDDIIGLLSDSDFISKLRIKPDELLEAYSGLKDMERKTIEVIEQSKQSICIFTNVFYWFDRVNETIEKAIQRNVNVRVIMTTTDEKAVEIASKLLGLGASVKHIAKENVLVRGTLVDTEQVVFVIWVSPKTGEKYIYRPHFSSNPGIIELFVNNFEYLWAKGENFQ